MNWKTTTFSCFPDRWKYAATFGKINADFYSDTKLITYIYRFALSLI